MTHEADVNAVKTLIDHWTNSANTNDSRRALGLVADDLEMIPPGEPPVSGKEAHALLRGFFENFTLGLHALTHEIVVSGDWAFRRYAYELKLAPKTGGNSTVLKGQGIHILARQRDGSWKVARDIWN